MSELFVGFWMSPHKDFMLHSYIEQQKSNTKNYKNIYFPVEIWHQSQTSSSFSHLKTLTVNLTVFCYSYTLRNPVQTTRFELKDKLFKLIIFPFLDQGCWKKESAADPADPGSSTRVEERQPPAGQWQWDGSASIAQQEKKEEKEKEKTCRDISGTAGEQRIRSKLEGGEACNKKDEERQQIWCVNNMLKASIFIHIIF